MAKYLIFALFVSSFAQGNTDQLVREISGAQVGTRVYLADDFFIQKVDRLSIRTFPTDCRAHISTAIIYQNKNGQQTTGPQAQKYVPRFQSIYDSLPAIFQKMFCYIEEIRVEESLKSTAYASTTINSEGNTAGVVGFRQAFLDQPLTLKHWLTWKEQLSFGATQQNSYEVSPDFPTVEAVIPGVSSDMLYQILIHEFGHLFDFANNVSISKGAWVPLSWDKMGVNKPKAGNDYHGRTGFCFYNCTTKFLSKEDANLIYSEMEQKTNFLNAYTSTNPLDDFAEASAIYVMTKIPGSKLLIDTKQGHVYDLMNKFTSTPIFESKRLYVENFYANPKLKYSSDE